MPAPRIRVLIVDDKAELRRSIRRLVSFDETLEVVGEAGDGKEAVEAAARLKPDVVLMDTRMPVLDGYLAAQHVARDVPGARVIVMMVKGEPHSMRRVVECGARAMLAKPFTSGELSSAVAQAYGETAVSRPVPPPPPVPTARGRVIAVFSTKGGVGKSMLLANLAVTLARQEGARVAAIDADLHSGALATLFGLSPTRTLGSLVQETPPWDAALVGRYLVRHEAGAVDVLCAPTRVEFARLVTLEHLRRCVALLRESHDYVLVDTVASVRDTELELLPECDRVLVLTTPDLPALRNTRAALDMLERAGVPDDRRVVVLNRAPPDEASAALVQRAHDVLQREIDLTVPAADALVLDAVNAGAPFMLRPELDDTELGEAFLILSAMVAAWAEA